MKYEKGKIIGNFVLDEKIETLDDFWFAINNTVSIFANGKVQPTAFFFSWRIRLIKIWIDNGWFFTIQKK